MELLRDVLVQSALTQGEKTAVRFFRGGLAETDLSYAKLHRDSSRLANFFFERGVRKGDRVILYMEKSLIFVVAHLGLQKIGAISVPLNPGLKKSEMEYFIQDSDPKLIMAGTAQEALIREIDTGAYTVLIDTDRPYSELDFFQSFPDRSPATELRYEDPGLIIYTSGTTGKPKGAVITQQNRVHDTRNILRTWQPSSTDVLCHALPLFHVHGLCFALHTALMAGARILMLDRFSPETVLERLTVSRGEDVCTVFMAVPPMYIRLLDFLGEKRPDFRHLRLITSGSAPLLPQDFERIRNVFGMEPVEREGMSETGMNFTNPLRGKRKPGSVGLPLPGLEVRVVDPETLQDVAPGETGELWLKGPGITPGYWRKPEETAKALAQGWFRTGDLGRVDEEGYYYLTDRLKHVIISGGENISPKEVEGVINGLEDVVESCVVGLPDERWGEKVAAAVVKRPGSDLDEDRVRAHCRKHLHDWKCPKSVLFTKALPRNTMGKVLKQEVVKLF